MPVKKFILPQPKPRKIWRHMEQYPFIKKSIMDILKKKYYPVRLTSLLIRTKAAKIPFMNCQQNLRSFMDVLVKYRHCAEFWTYHSAVIPRYYNKCRQKDRVMEYRAKIRAENIMKAKTSNPNYRPLTRYNAKPKNSDAKPQKSDAKPPKSDAKPAE